MHLHILIFLRMVTGAVKGKLANLDSILKSRDVTSSAKVCIAKAVVFPIVTDGCESWTLKKAECQRVDAFKLRSWRRLLIVLWTARSHQSILKEINPEYSLEEQMENWISSTWATWYKEQTHWKRHWCWEKLKAGGEGTTEIELVGWHHRLDGPEFKQVPAVGDRQGSLACCSPCGCKETVMTEKLNWTEWTQRMKVSTVFENVLVNFPPKFGCYST